MVQYELNIRDYLRIIRKRQFVIMASFVLFGGASFLYSKTEQVLYEAVATIKIEERRPVPGVGNEWQGYQFGDVMETTSKIIKGSLVVKRAALLLGRIQGNENEDVIGNAITSLQGSFETGALGATNIIKITATSEIARDAARIANAVAEAAIEENRQEKNKQARTTRQFIEEQLRVVEQSLSQAENTMRQFGAAANNEPQQAGVRQRLTDLQMQLTAMLQKYTEKHPRVISLRQQIKELENQFPIMSVDATEYDRLKREVEANRKIFTMLRERLEEAKIAEAEKVPDLSWVDRALVPAVPARSRSPVNIILGSLLGLVLGLILSFLVESFDTSIGTIEDVEGVIKLPVLGVIPSISLDEDEKKRGGVWAEIKQYFKSRARSEKEVHTLRLIAHFRPSSPITESFRNLKTNLKISSHRKVFLITSAGPQEGKSTILSNLGIVCAQDGLKTVMVSADLRRPTLVASFGLSAKPGLTDIVLGTATLDDCLKSVADVMVGNLNIDEVLKHPGLGYLHLLPSGSVPMNPTEIIGSREVDAIIGQLRERFDVVLFDAPPILPVADATILAPKMDAVLLCYEIGRTSRHALSRTKGQLESAKASIAGIVLNHTKPETEIAEVYPYYYKYKYYGAQPEGKPAGDQRHT